MLKNKLTIEEITLELREVHKTFAFDTCKAEW